jgi:two-component system sensor histidine kinase YesM
VNKSSFWFRNISILKKMLLILAITFLIPLIITGLLLVWYIGARDTEYEYQQDLGVLESISRELAGTLNSAEGIAELIAAKGLIWKFSGGMENYRDYISLTELSDDILRNIPLVKSIILFRDDQVIFERGPALASDFSPWPEDLAAALKAGGSPCWLPPRDMSYFDRSSDGLLTPVYRLLSPGPSPLTLFVGLSSRDMAAHYSSYSRGYLYLVNSQGLVLSSGGNGGETGGILPGELYPPELFSRFSGEKGFLRNARILYTKGYRGWYLVNHIPDEQYRLKREGLQVIVLLAAVLGICFASACLIMQRRYIFHPLKTMLAEMDQFREGNLEAKMSYHSGDEIGRINREVERIFNRLHDLIHEVYISRIYNQEATLKMLTSQINPHFIYNTLDSIRWKAIQNRDPEVGEQIEALSDLFRHVLNRGADLVTVDQEIKHLETYLYIMNFRYRDRITCSISVGDGVRAVYIPKLILQPIVENAMLHGIEKQAGPGEIAVHIEEDRGLLSIRIWDNGVGTDSRAVNRMLEEADDQNGSFALKNINRRIKLCYGDEYGLVFESESGKGTTVSLVVPLKVKERQ